MSDSNFWNHYSQHGGHLSDEDTDDGTYRPWVTVSAHSDDKPAKLLLVPAHHVSSKTLRIPYLQLIIHELDRDTGQLCLMFPSSGMKVFLEGRGLEELDELIDTRRVKSVHMFDEAIHHWTGNDVAVVTNITVEKS